MPYVESPMIGVVTMMPGLSAQEMELYVAKPIEEQLVNVKNLHYIRSTSQDGFAIVSLEFNYGTDMKKALFDVQSLMNVVQANLPATGANLKPSWVLQIDPLNLPILSLRVTGDSRWDKTRLREFVDNEVVNRIKTIPQVYSVVPFGGFKRQLQVIVDRDKLAAYKLSILDVKNAIDRYNVAKSAGVLTHGPNESIVRVDSHATNARTVLNYPITTSPLPAAGRVGVGSEDSLPAAGRVGAGPPAPPPSPNPKRSTSAMSPASSTHTGSAAAPITSWITARSRTPSRPPSCRTPRQARRRSCPPSKRSSGSSKARTPASFRGRLRQRPLRRHPLQEHVRGAGAGDSARRPSRCCFSSASGAAR